jgi:hypothetical protein
MITVRIWTGVQYLLQLGIYRRTSDTNIKIHMKIEIRFIFGLMLHLTCRMQRRVLVSNVVRFKET